MPTPPLPPTGLSVNIGGGAVEAVGGFLSSMSPTALFNRFRNVAVDPSAVISGGAAAAGGAAGGAAAATGSPMSPAGGSDVATSNRLTYEVSGKPIEPVAPVRKNKNGKKSQEYKKQEDQIKILMKQYRKELDK